MAKRMKRTEFDLAYNQRYQNTCPQTTTFNPQDRRKRRLIFPPCVKTQCPGYQTCNCNTCELQNVGSVSCGPCVPFKNIRTIYDLNMQKFYSNNK